MDTITGITQKRAEITEELDLSRAKHLFVQWLVSGDRRVVPSEARAFINLKPEEARELFDRFRRRSRQKAKGKKYLFTN